jgi:hypothetical protein
MPDGLVYVTDDAERWGPGTVGAPICGRVCSGDRHCRSELALIENLKPPHCTPTTCVAGSRTQDIYSRCAVRVSSTEARRWCSDQKLRSTSWAVATVRVRLDLRLRVRGGRVRPARSASRLGPCFCRPQPDDPDLCRQQPRQAGPERGPEQGHHQHRAGDLAQCRSPARHHHRSSRHIHGACRLHGTCHSAGAPASQGAPDPKSQRPFDPAQAEPADLLGFTIGFGVDGIFVLTLPLVLKDFVSLESAVIASGLMIASRRLMETICVHGRSTPAPQGR